MPGSNLLVLKIAVSSILGRGNSQSATTPGKKIYRHLVFKKLILLCIRKFAFVLFCFRSNFSMASKFRQKQQTLTNAWNKARRDGELTPNMQATVNTLHKQWQKDHGQKRWGMLKWIAGQVKKQGKGKPDGGGKPSSSAIVKFLKKKAGDRS